MSVVARSTEWSSPRSCLSLDGFPGFVPPISNAGALTTPWRGICVLETEGGLTDIGDKQAPYTAI